LFQKSTTQKFSDIALFYGRNTIEETLQALAMDVTNLWSFLENVQQPFDKEVAIMVARHDIMEALDMAVLDFLVHNKSKVTALNCLAAVKFICVY